MSTPLRLVYEEDRLTVLDKPSGLASEDAAAQVGLKLVHRLDKPTSGLLVLASDARAVQRMQRLMARGELAREYWLVAHGDLSGGVYERPLARDRGDGLRGSRPDGLGKPARTEVEVLARHVGCTTACARLVTGRTHQIRIHLAEAGHPLLGEQVYVRDHRAAGRPLLDAPRLMLHAWRLSFVHPMTKREVRLECPPPDFSPA
jgi:23S rRNA pseudouridine1911/1915/1917 synthase